VKADRCGMTSLNISHSHTFYMTQLTSPRFYEKHTDICEINTILCLSKEPMDMGGTNENLLC